MAWSMSTSHLQQRCHGLQLMMHTHKFMSVAFVGKKQTEKLAQNATWQ